MTCSCNSVPVISAFRAVKILALIPKERRQQILQAAMAWLTERHEGIESYNGIVSRKYTNQEKDTIAVDTAAVAGLSCPFMTIDGCLLGGLGPHYNRAEETGKQPYLFLPMAVAREWAREDIKELVSRGYVADAKVAFLTRNEAFLSKSYDGAIMVG